MSYIGNQVTSVPHVIDTFSGNGATTSFGPLVRAPAGTAAIAVFISGVYRTPGVDYVLNGDYIIFFVAPSNGTNNIVVHHLGNGTTTQVPSDGSVTGTKLAINSVRGNNIVAGQITGNLIGLNAVSGNQIGASAISGNQIGLSAISGNQIGASAISGNQIGLSAISGNQIGLYAISGNQIGTGAISANNFAGGGITSNVLAPNLTLTLTRTNETTNLFSTAPGGNVNIDIANSTLYYFTSNTTANVTFNLRANNTNTFDSVVRVGETVTVTIMLRHSTASGGRHTANVYIDGGLITTNRTNPDQAGANNLFYVANIVPLYATTIAGTGFEMNMYNISVFKRDANTYTVFMSNTNAQIG